MKKQKFSLLAWLNNRPIRVKLGIGFGAITGLALLLGGVTLFVGKIEGQALARLNHTAVESASMQTLQADLLQMRRHEKDFLLRYEDLGYDAAWAQYADLNNELFGTVSGSMVEIRARHVEADASNPGFVESLDQVESQFGIYATFFKQVVSEDIPARGTRLEGPIPEIRQQIDQLDEVVLDASAIDLVSQVDELSSQFSDYVAISEPGHAPLDAYLPLQAEQMSAVNATLDQIQQSLESELQPFASDGAEWYGTRHRYSPATRQSGSH